MVIDVSHVALQGFVISDWQGIDRITDPPHSNYTHSVQASIQAGIDMVSGNELHAITIFCCKLKISLLPKNVRCLLSYQVMVPYNHTEFIDTLTRLVNDKVIPVSRIDDAVERILRVKFMMGLFENPLSDQTFSAELGSQVGLFPSSVQRISLE